MLKKIRVPLGILLVSGLIIAFLVTAKPKPQPQPVTEEAGRMQALVTRAQPQAMSLSVETQGTVEPKREIDLVAEVSGRIVRVAPEFADGGFFEADQPLVEIDGRDYQAALLSARAQLAEAARLLAEEQGRSEQARREWRDLGSQAANDLFTRKPQLAAAQANLEAARGQVTLAELDLERTRVSVPFAGRVRSTQVNVGEYVTVGSPLATVYDAGLVQIRLPLTEDQAALIDLPFTPNDRSEEPIPVRISASLAGEPHQWLGRLVRTEAFVDADSRLYYALVEVADPFDAASAGGDRGAPLLPGLFVTADIQGKRLDRVMRLPRAALYERDKLKLLDADHKVVEQIVKVWRQSSTHVWVRAQSDGEHLVALEKQSLMPVGTPVDPLFESPGADSSLAASADTPNKD